MVALGRDCLLFKDESSVKMLEMANATLFKERTCFPGDRVESLVGAFTAFI